MESSSDVSAADLESVGEGSAVAYLPARNYAYETVMSTATRTERRAYRSGKQYRLAEGLYESGRAAPS